MRYLCTARVQSVLYLYDAWLRLFRIVVNEACLDFALYRCVSVAYLLSYVFADAML